MTPLRIIPVGEEPPPMEGPEPVPSGNNQHGHQGRKRDRPKGKRGERFAVLNSFVDFTLAELGRAEIAVWLVLYRDSREGIARTGQTDIARRAGVNRRTVYRALRRLEGRGLVKIVYTGGLGRGLSCYRVRGLERDAGRGT